MVVLTTQSRRDSSETFSSGFERYVSLIRARSFLSAGFHANEVEFMDRQKLMSLVQFWVVVDGFRNPLEDDFGDEAAPTQN
jgi:hypothetical protein